MLKSLLHNHIESVTKALRGKFAFTVSPEGNFALDGAFKSFFKKIFVSENKQMIRLGHALMKALEDIESHSEQTQLTPYAECIDLIINNLNQISSQESKDLILSLECERVALKARLSSKNQVSLPLCNKLKPIISAWKKNEKSLETSVLDTHDILQIQTTSLYPEFVELITKNRALFEAFAIFVFRDRVKAEIFIEYPHLAKKLFESNLTGRIGRVNGNIQIKWIDGKRIVTLPFEGKDINILDENQVVELKSHYTLTVKECFEIFKNKTFEVGNLEYLAGGVTNWNVHKWAVWNGLKRVHEPINLSHQNWWWLLPTFEIASRMEVENRYGIGLGVNNWCVSASATSLTKTLDYENTHAFMEIAIPLGNGSYNILDFGKFATVFPSSFLDALSMFCHNLHATVAFPDENIYYLHRARAYQSFLITEEQGRELMNHIKRDMFKGMEMNFVYQIESDNCAKWVNELLVSILGQEKVPEMFKIHLLETEPTSFVSYIFKAIKLLPSHWQTDVMTFFHLPMGAWKETWIYEQGRRVCKSLTNHEFWETGIVFLPALLLKLKEAGLLEEFREGILHTKRSIMLKMRRVKERLLMRLEVHASSQRILWELVLSRRRGNLAFRPQSVLYLSTNL